MGKISFLILIGMVSFVYADPPLKEIPPLDRYGGHYDTNPDKQTGVHYRFYKEPHINDFESRAIMEDIYTIINATGVLSECSRWKAFNLLLEMRADPYINYPAGVHRTSFDMNSLVYYSTASAVFLGLMDPTQIEGSVRFSTIPICLEGKSFNYKGE